MENGSRNDLYIRDRMERNAQDYEGSGIGSGLYDIREERRHSLREIQLPLVLSVFFLVCLGAAVYGQVSEQILKATGYCVMADYNYKQESAYVVLPNGWAGTVDAQWAMLDKNDRQVPVYYYENAPQKAQVLTSVKFWSIAYAVLGGALSICIFWLYKQLHRSRHAKTVMASGKFE